MSRGDPLRVDDYLGHIVEAIFNISEYSSRRKQAINLR